jgi:hypothetical protein
MQFFFQPPVSSFSLGPHILNTRILKTHSVGLLVSEKAQLHICAKQQAELSFCAF